jgi:hypothetical protein
MFGFRLEAKMDNTVFKNPTEQNYSSPELPQNQTEPDEEPVEKGEDDKKSWPRRSVEDPKTQRK